MNNDKSNKTAPQTKWRPRFGLATMLMIMLICCVMAAAGNYLVQAWKQGTSVVGFFVIFTLVAPILLLISVSVSVQVLKWVKRNSRR